jgi:hypothetical protein
MIQAAMLPAKFNVGSQQFWDSFPGRKTGLLFVGRCVMDGLAGQIRRQRADVAWLAHPLPAPEWRRSLLLELHTRALSDHKLAESGQSDRRCRIRTRRSTRQMS